MPDRSISEVLQDIIGNVQEIVRSEVHLAKTEIGAEAKKAARASVTLAVDNCSRAVRCRFSFSH